MTFRTLPALATVLLIGCSSDGATVAEFDEDTGGIQPGDTGSSTETAADTGTAGDTSTPPGDSMMPPTDTPVADTPATTTAMKCGAFTCNTGTQECCVLAGVGACISKGAACAGARWGCTSKANCDSGQVCCVSGAGTGGGSCAPSGMCPSTTTCETGADCMGSMKTCTDLGAGIKACSK